MSSPEKAWVPLTHRERRVVGVLVEKQKTTPEYYPLSVAALVTGCNQKSNRDPVTNYDADDIEETLNGLRSKGAAVLVEGSGRVVRWKHTLYDWLGLRGREVDMAVLAELLLRGPQTEGDLRGRASRMNAIPDLATLQMILERLTAQGLAVYLSPPGQKRGVVVTHGLYPPEELEKVRHQHALGAAEREEAPERPTAVPPPPGLGDEVAALRTEVETLKAAVQALSEELQALKSALGV